MTNHQSAEDQFLLGAKGPKSVSFLTVGDKVSGKVKEKALTQQRDLEDGTLKTWDDGSPRMQLVVTLTGTGMFDPEVEDDDGTRRLFVDKPAMRKAIAAAVKAAGATGLEVGSTLTVEFTGTGTPVKRGFNGPKEFSAKYTPAADVALNTDESPASAPAAANGLPAGLEGLQLTPEALAALQNMAAKQQ